MDRHERQALDDHITGHGGEDQFSREEAEERVGDVTDDEIDDSERDPDLDDDEDEDDLDEDDEDLDTRDPDEIDEDEEG